MTYESIRLWCVKFSHYFKDVIKKRGRKPYDKWHLDEMNIRIHGKAYILWRAVDCKGHELDVLVQRRRNKKAAIRFLSKLLGSYPTPRVAVTDKLHKALTSWHCSEGHCSEEHCSVEYVVAYFRHNYAIFCELHVPNEFQRFIMLAMTIPSFF